MRIASVLTLVGGAALLLGSSSCGSGVFNPAFVNSLVGGQIPVTPGPPAAFVLVRGLNETNQTVEFIVTIQRAVLVTDDEGNFQVDDQGNFITEPKRETVRLNTSATGLGTDVGVLFPCGESPVTIVGLGENLQPTDAAVFVGGEGAGGNTGFGVRAESLFPLRIDVGNFNCGDTIVFQAFASTGVAGGVALQTFLLPGSEQPSEFSGPSTFANYEEFLAAQSEEE
jgi:hypothetical protein